MKSISWHILSIYNILRHNFMRIPIIGRKYAEYKIRKRRGKCLDCGNCCFNHQEMRYCIHRKNGKCEVYEERKCNKFFPLDNLDVKIVGCKGYYFTKEKD